MIRTLLAWGCGLLMPVAWRVMRWIEHHARAGQVVALPSATVIPDGDNPWWWSNALESGPGIDSIVGLDGTILWQRGGGLMAYHNLPNGWTGLQIPAGSRTRAILDGVLRSKQPRSYNVSYEGVHYEGVAYPWHTTTDRGPQIAGVVFRAMPLLPRFDEVPNHTDEHLDAMRGYAREARRLYNTPGGSDAQPRLASGA